MSILETFYILFKSDASDVKKGAEEAKKSTQKLNEELNNTETATGKVGAAFSRMATEFIGVIAAAVSVGTVIAGIKAATDYSIQLGITSKQLGVSATQLDAWGQAAKRFGGTAEGFQSSLKGLSEHLGASPAIALKVLPQLADVFQKIGRVRAQRYGTSLGLDQSTIYMLQQGRREVEAVIAKQKELGLVSQANIDVAAKYNRSVMDTRDAFRGIFLELSLAVLPALTKFMDLILPAIEYLREHIELVKGAAIAIAAVAAVMIAPFIVANAAVIAVAAGVAFLIGLFAIAYEDIKAFMNGQSSLIGDILKKWPMVGTVAKAAFEALKLTLWAMIEPFRLIEKLVEKIFSYFKGPNKTLTVDIKGGQALLDKDKNVTNDIKNGQALLKQASNSPLNPLTQSSLIASRTFSPSRNITTGPITINTQATDANGIAMGLQNGLNEHLWQANSNFDDGQLA